MSLAVLPGAAVGWELVLAVSAAVAAAGVLGGFALGRWLPSAPPTPPRVDPAPPAEGSTRTLSADVYLAYLSHELRTPLTAILGYSELLEEDARSQAESLLPDVRRVRSAGTLLLAVLDDAIDLWRVQGGVFEVVPQRFDPSRLLKEVASELAPVFETGSASLDVDPGDLPTVRTDRVKLRRALSNLIRFSGELGAGVVTVRASVAAGGLTVVVGHEGVARAHPRVESLLHLLSETGVDQSAVVQGAGIGPVVAIELARVLDGSVRIEFPAPAGIALVLAVPSQTGGPDDTFSGAV